MIYITEGRKNRANKVREGIRGPLRINGQDSPMMSNM